MIQTLDILSDAMVKLAETLNKYLIQPILGSILNILNNVLRHIWALICNIVYGLITMFFDVINAIPKLDILSEVGVEGIYQRITVILTIVMTFYITFQVIKYVVQPDMVNDKQQGAGNIAFKLIAVILLIAFVPKIFTIAYDLQGRILDSEVISKIMLGNSSKTYETAGGNFSANLLGVFYGVNPAVCGQGKTAATSAKCSSAKTIVNMNLALIRNRWTGGGTSGIAQAGQLLSALMLQSGLDMMWGATDGSSTALQPVIYFEGLLAIIVGIYVVFTLMKYGVEIAKRQFQLIYLQITAPIAIIGYISPKKDNAFSKWLNQCITTYLDLFIRLIILHFVIIILDVLHDAVFQGSTSEFGALAAAEGKIPVLCFVYIFMMIGLFQFMKKAPKLLKELLPQGNAASGDFSLPSFKDAQNTIGGVSRAIGGTVGMINGARQAFNSDTLKNSKNGKDRWLSAFKGGVAGAKAGYGKGGGIKKANAAARASVFKDEDTVTSGGTVTGATFHGHRAAKTAQDYDRQIKRNEDISKAKDTASATANSHKMMGFIAGHQKEMEEKNWGTASSRENLTKKIAKELRAYSVTEQDNASTKSTSVEIAKLIDDFYHEEFEKVKGLDLTDEEKAKRLSELKYSKEQTIENAQALLINDSQKLTGLKEDIETGYKDSIGAKYTIEEPQKDADGKILKDADGNAVMKKKIGYVGLTPDEAKTMEENYERMYPIPIGATAEALAEYEETKEKYIESQIKSMIASDEAAGDAAAKARLQERKTTYAKDIGDVQDAAQNRNRIIRSSHNYRQAKAEAEASGKQ